MIAPEQQRNWFRYLAEQGKTRLPGGAPPWLADLRAEGEQALDELPPLNRKMEAWRYISMDRLMGQMFQPAGAITGIGDVDTAKDIIPGLEAYRLHFVNGRLLPPPAAGLELPDGLQLGTLREQLITNPEWVGHWLGRLADTRAHLFTALNTALLGDGVLVHLAPGTRLKQPIEIIYHSLPAEAQWSAQLRSLIVLEAGAEATLVERFVGRDQAVYFENGLSEIVVGEGATLTHYRVMEESARGHHLSSLYIRLDAASRYRGMALALGEGLSRDDFYVNFHAEGGECLLSGLYTVQEGQHCEFHLDVNHGVPNCTSRENFRGVLYGKGRAVFDGHVLVGRQAQQSDARMTNDNLLLTRDAEIDTKPQLEIFADDVKCSHGTTVGQLDSQQLFYLCSRGIGESTARKMLCMGFVREIVDQIELRPLRAYSSAILERKLNAIVIAR